MRITQQNYNQFINDASALSMHGEFFFRNASAHVEITAVTIAETENTVYLMLVREVSTSCDVNLLFEQNIDDSEMTVIDALRFDTIEALHEYCMTLMREHMSDIIP